MDDIYILNIETSTKACSVSINCNGNLINCKEIVSSGFSHSEKLLPFISQTIEKSKINMSDLTAVAVSMGPGSFTGLRIGCSVAQGLAYGLNIPILPISSLKILAQQVIDIENSLNIPLGDIASKMDQFKDKDQPIITCCASGMRSAAAAKIFSAKGFTNVVNGGGWSSLEAKINK